MHFPPHPCPLIAVYERMTLNMPLVTVFTAASWFSETIDLAWSDPSNGNVFHQWWPNGTPAQQLAIEHVSGGWHTVGGWSAAAWCHACIRTAFHSLHPSLTAVSALLMTWHCTLCLRHLQIKHAASGKCAQLDGTQASLHIWDCEEGDATQLFGFASVGNEGVRIFVKATLNCLDVEAGLFRQERCSNTTSQMFRLQGETHLQSMAAPHHQACLGCLLSQ